MVLTLATDCPALVAALIRHPSPFKPFLPLLRASNNPEDPMALLTSSVLSTLLSHALTSTPPLKDTAQLDEALPQMYAYLAQLSTSSDAGFQDIAMQEYSAVLRTRRARESFWQLRRQTLTPLISILRAATGGKDGDSSSLGGGSTVRSVPEGGISGGVGLQLLYHVLLVIWQLSFEGELVGEGLQEYAPLRCPRDGF